MPIHSSNARGIVAGILAAALVLRAAAASADTAKAADYAISCLNLSPGGNATELDFAWFSGSAAKAVVQVAKASDMTGGDFPAAKARSFFGSQAEVEATQFNTTDASAPTGAYANRVVATGLAGSSSYVYRVGDGEEWSGAYGFATRNERSFGFLVVGDPQLGAASTGPKTLDSDTAGLTDTLDKATGKYPSASFLLSLGRPGKRLQQARGPGCRVSRLLQPGPAQLPPRRHRRRQPRLPDGKYDGYHYNPPNLSNSYGASYGNDGDYWFAYGDALFLMLNSNTESVATHDLFIRDAIAKNPGAKWRIVGFHHAIYNQRSISTIPTSSTAGTTTLRSSTATGSTSSSRAMTTPTPGPTRCWEASPGWSRPRTQTAPRSIRPALCTSPSTRDRAASSTIGRIRRRKSSARSAGRARSPPSGYIEASGDSLKIAVYRTDDMSVVDSCSIVKTK